MIAARAGLGLFLLVATAAAEPLESFTQVRALSQDEASNALPVRVDAVVLGVDPASPWSLFLHDGVAGCYVKLLPGTNAPDFPPGTRLQVNGVSMPLGYYPSVGGARARVLGSGTLPEPVRLSADQIYSPELDSAWVEVPAVVVGYELGDERFTLDVEVYGLPFKAELPLQPGVEERAAAFLQRPVRLRGVLGTIFNRQRQMTDRHFFLSSLDSITFTRAPVEGEEAPLIEVGQLLTGSLGTRTPVRVEGRVTQVDERGFYLRDESGSTLVRAARAGRFPPGSRVLAEGFGDVAPFRPILRATRVVQLGAETPPLPVPFDFETADLPMMHSELVTVQADFLGQREGRVESILQCRAGRQIFEALLPGGKSQLNDLVPGDRLRLTGICELTTTHALPRVMWVDGFRLHLPATGGVEVVSRAPWWTPGRLLVALGLMSTLAALGLAGTWMLRRQVNRQLALITDSLRSEAVGKERDRMARDLHDTLEQQLSGIALQLDGLNDAIKANPEGAARSLSLARRMLRFTRLEARRSVWDLRSKVLEKEGLVAALQAMAHTTAGPSGPTVEVTVTGEARRLPTAVEFHFLRIAQEALTNAVKHAEARHVTIELDHAPEATRLTVRDDGRGFDPEDPALASGLHFGLMGMRERAAKIDGQLTVTASPGAGCVVSVRVANAQPLPTA